MIRVDEWKLKISESGSKVLDKAEAAADAAARAMGRAQREASKMTGSASHKLSGFMGKLKGNVKELAAGAAQGIEDALTEGARKASPRMGHSLAGAAGPLALALTLAVGGVSKALAEANRFRPAIDELRYATNTKGKADIDKLNSRVLGTSAAVGIDPVATAKGYSDLVKVTGFVNEQADRVVVSVGRASKVLGVDFNGALRGTASTMSAFGLGASQVDQVIAANQQTIDKAAISYDELTKAQGRFGRAAAASNQTVSSANQLFTLYVRGTNDASQAATLTKGTLEALGKVKTEEWFAKIGVQTRDAKGNIRQVGDVVRDLVPALAKLNEQDFAKLREKVGGNEGLRGMLDLARSSGVEVTAALADMKTATASYIERMDDANRSASMLSDTLSARVTTAWVRVGQAMESSNMQKIIAGALETASDLVNVLASIPDYLASLTASATDSPAALGKVIKNARFRAQTAYATDVAMANAAIIDLSSEDKGVRDKALSMFIAKADKLKTERAIYLKSMKGAVTVTGKTEDAAYVDELDAQMKALAARYFESKQGAGNEQKAKGSEADVSQKMHDALFGDEKKTGARQGVEKVVGGGSQVRNVTVTIQRLVDRIEVNSKTVREGINGSEIKQLVTQALVDAVRGGEAALANQ